jgi:hypothetical protein
MEQTRINDGIWMPERVEVQAVAKIFFLKSLSIDHVMIYSDNRLPQTARLNKRAVAFAARTRTQEGILTMAAGRYATIWRVASGRLARCRATRG